MELIYFFLGGIFIQFISPFLDGILSLFLTYLEAKKIKYTEAINQSNIKMQQAVSDSEPKSVIGFAAYEEEVDEENDF